MGLILIHAALELMTPLLSVAGAYDALGGRPIAPIVLTVLIAGLWVGAVVTARAPNPLLTLTLAGGLYGVFAILLQQAIWNLFLGDPPEGAPRSTPVLVLSWVGILVTNTIWGAFLGLVATGLSRSLPGRAASSQRRESSPSHGPR